MLGTSSVLSNEGAAMSSIRDFWRKLEGSVHPEDAATLNSRPHTFNLDFPPPAFIGDVDNAPVVILMLNGGHHPTITPAEFAAPGDLSEFLRWMKDETSEIPRNLSPYYTQHRDFPLVRNGSVAIVNSLAYRSPGLSAQNRRIASLLPSVKAHRRWLRQEVLPDAISGKRLIIAHRPGLWDFTTAEFGDTKNVHFSKNPVSPHLAEEMREKMNSWLSETSLLREV
jgi:hypothetical protein